MPDLSSIYARVTARILAGLEQGVRPWTKPWQDRPGIDRPLRHNGLPYRGINVLILWDEAFNRGYGNRHWMTFKQATQLGGRVKKGEHHTQVVYTNVARKLDTDMDGNEIEKNIPFLKVYGVFNVEQIEGLPEQYYLTPPAPSLSHEFFTSTGADIRYGFNKAAYSEKKDIIFMPEPAAFLDHQSCYATLTHELIHWTKHKDRLNRDLGAKAFGDEGYAKEEIVAELGSAFVCAALGICPEPLEEHGNYLGFWVESMQEDSKYIFKEVSHAQQAADYLFARHCQAPA